MCLCIETLPTWLVSGTTVNALLKCPNRFYSVGDHCTCGAWRIFVLIVSADMNLLAVLTYAVEQLKVKHILVTGHYDCGGIRAAVKARNFGQALDSWLQVSTMLYFFGRNKILDILNWFLTARYLLINPEHSRCVSSAQSGIGCY